MDGSHDTREPISASFEPLPDQLVLQCGGCKTILGDTHDFVCTATVGQTNLLVLSAGTDISVDRVLQSTDAAGASCTHFPVCCCGCGSAVGRMYTRPPPGLEALVNTFAMEASRCSSYRLGSADVRVATSEPAERPVLRAGGGHVGPQQPAEPRGAAAADLLGRLDALETELLKMQGMILLHDQQLQALPHYPSNAAGDSTGAGAGGVDAEGMLYGHPAPA